MRTELQSYVEDVREYFSSGKGSVILNTYRRGHIRKEDFLDNVTNYIHTFKLEKEEAEAVLEAYTEFIWGYDVLKPLIEAEDVFDIHCNAYNNIRIKQLVGKKTIRTGCGIEFESPRHFNDFIDMLALRNKIGLPDSDAQKVFVDKESSPDFRLRCDITSAYLNCSGEKFLHIRKEPKRKKKLVDLLAEGMIIADLMDVCHRAAQGPILVSGESGAGKSIFVNAEIEEIPVDRNGLILQEEDELFSENHPDIIAFHTILLKRGMEGTEYTFHDLAKTAMMQDRDYLIFSEVKGVEAADVFTAAITGHNPWLTLHAGGNRAAAYQLANLVHMSTTYELTDIFRMLGFIRFTLFHITDYVVDEVTVMEGWNEETHEIRFRDIYKEGECL